MTALAPTRNVTGPDSVGGARGRGFDVVRIALARDKSTISMPMIELEPTRAERSAAQLPVRTAAERSDAERSDAGRSGSSAARPWVDGFLPDTKQWFVTTPAVVVLKDGQDLAGWDAEGPKMEQRLGIHGRRGGLADRAARYKAAMTMGSAVRLPRCVRPETLMGIWHMRLAPAKREMEKVFPISRCVAAF